MDKLHADERVANRDIQCDDLIAAVNRILAPYSVDVKEVVWWSVYEIGHRLTDKFDNAGNTGALPRVFIAGDACHTHSPKAGQGMNVSMGDAFNLGWKLVQVLNGLAPPELLLTYSSERQAVAQGLIDFDHQWARIMSAPPEEQGGPDGPTPLFQKYFIEHGRYTAGLSVRYEPSELTGEGSFQHLATGLDIGMRFHSAPVIRLGDGKPVELGHTQKADARWTLYIFAGGQGQVAELASIGELCAFLESDTTSPIKRHTPAGADIDAVIDVRAVFKTSHESLEITDMPALLFPTKGALGLRDYEKAFCVDPREGDIFALRGIDRDKGCMVLVRPDQYVATILPLDARAELSAFFGRVLLKAN